MICKYTDAIIPPEDSGYPIFKVTPPLNTNTPSRAQAHTLSTSTHPLNTNTLPVSVISYLLSLVCVAGRTHVRDFPYPILVCYLLSLSALAYLLSLSALATYLLSLWLTSYRLSIVSHIIYIVTGGAHVCHGTSPSQQRPSGV